MKSFRSPFFCSFYLFSLGKSRRYADKKTTTRTRTATKLSKTPSERRKLAQSLAPIVHTDGWQRNIYLDRQTVGLEHLKNQEIYIFSKYVGNAAAIFFKKICGYWIRFSHRYRNAANENGPIINAPNYRRWLLVFFCWSVSLKQENPQISVSGGGG